MVNIDLARDISAGFLAHQRVEARGKLAFAGGFVCGQQCVCNDQTQHPVAQKFKPLIVLFVGSRNRGMGQRPDQQLGRIKPMPQPVGKCDKLGTQLHQLIFLNNRSGRQVQTNKSDRPADENMIRSARPIRFSNGTKPAPPASWRSRLSVELSRLSPMKKY